MRDNTREVWYGVHPLHWATSPGPSPMGYRSINLLLNGTTMAFTEIFSTDTTSWNSNNLQVYSLKATFTFRHSKNKCNREFLVQRKLLINFLFWLQCLCSRITEDDTKKKSQLHFPSPKLCSNAKTDSFCWLRPLFIERIVGGIAGICRLFLSPYKNGTALPKRPLDCTPKSELYCH